MKHEEALEVAKEVEDSIKHLTHLYVSVIIKENGNRTVVVRKKGVSDVN